MLTGTQKVLLWEEREKNGESGRRVGEEKGGRKYNGNANGTCGHLRPVYYPGQRL